MAETVKDDGVIREGDEVHVWFGDMQHGPDLTGKVMHVPVATGDCWIIHANTSSRPDGKRYPINVMHFAAMQRNRPVVE